MPVRSTVSSASVRGQDNPAALHGVPGLRVVDASVFPAIPTVNPVVTVMVTAERAADMIRQ